MRRTIVLGVAAAGLSAASGMLALAPLSDAVSGWLWRNVPALRSPDGDWAAIAIVGPLLLAGAALVLAAAARLHRRAMGWVRMAIRGAFVVGSMSAGYWSGMTFVHLVR